MGAASHRQGQVGLHDPLGPRGVIQALSDAFLAFGLPIALPKDALDPS